MHFEVAFPANRITNNALVYRQDEYSFDVVPQRENFTSVLINDINLELNREGRVVQVWGYCPYMTWKPATLAPPQAEFGDVIFFPDSPLKGGVSTRLTRERWPVFVDRSSGWVHVDGGCKAATAVKILTGVIVQVDLEGNLCGIWLSPPELPERR
jgi:hypothetical protein